jgi:hypothetical protein
MQSDCPMCNFPKSDWGSLDLGAPKGVLREGWVGQESIDLRVCGSEVCILLDKIKVSVYMIVQLSSLHRQVRIGSPTSFQPLLFHNDQPGKHLG